MNDARLNMTGKNQTERSIYDLQKAARNEASNI